MKVTNNTHGLTLVETMIAILLFGTVLVGLLDICANGMLMGKRSDRSYAAYNLAKNHIETLKTMSFGSLSSAAETDTLLDSRGVPDLEGEFKRNTGVSISYNGDANLVSVTVTVDYQVKGSFSGNPVTLSTVIFQYA
jgi:Tfp pilus assembly protein PilV